MRGKAQIEKRPIGLVLKQQVVLNQMHARLRLLSVRNRAGAIADLKIAAFLRQNGAFEVLGIEGVGVLERDLRLGQSRGAGGKSDEQQNQHESFHNLTLFQYPIFLSNCKYTDQMKKRWRLY